jgi:hypothetical protein
MTYSKSASLAESAFTSFRELSASAETLNSVSDALGKTVSDIDEGLRKLNLGVSAWVLVGRWNGADERDLSYTIEELGYDKLNGKWGVVLRARSGNEEYPEDNETVERWPFNDAARSLRLRAIKQIPELLKKLNNEAIQLTHNVQAQLANAQAVAGAVQDAAKTKLAPGSLSRKPELQPATTDSVPPDTVSLSTTGSVAPRPAKARPGLQPAGPRPGLRPAGAISGTSEVKR